MNQQPSFVRILAAEALKLHSLRKSWAVRLYEASGHDLLVVRDGLGHSSVAVTQLYLPTDRARIEEMIVRSDWTRSRKPATRKIATPVPPVLAAKPRPPTQGPAPCLPGFEHFAA